MNVVTEYEHVYDKNVIECTCKIQLYTICMLVISLLGIIGLTVLNGRKLKLFKDYLFSDAKKVILFISDANIMCY